jgi:hypothetical protein
MRCGFQVAAASLLVLVGCGAVGVSSSIPGTAAPSTLSVASADRPWTGTFDWTVTRLEWADPSAPFSGVTSTFGGRCSVPSDYVIYSSFKGEATHAGRSGGDGSHCSQLHLTPSGPQNTTYSDGRGTLVTANGSTIELRWGDGTSWTDEQGVTFFKDTFTIAGGTGTFKGASGGGEEGGSFKDFTALLGGTPAKMWQEGTIIYTPASR